MLGRAKRVRVEKENTADHHRGYGGREAEEGSSSTCPLAEWVEWAAWTTKPLSTRTTPSEWSLSQYHLLHIGHRPRIPISSVQL